MLVLCLQEKKAMEKAHESDEIYRTPTPVAPNDATWQQVQELEVRPTTQCICYNFYSRLIDNNSCNKHMETIHSLTFALISVN